MATETIVTVVCDRCGAPDATERLYGLDGTDYRADLCERHWEQLQKALASYVEIGTRVGGKRSTGLTHGPRRKMRRSGPAPGDVRAWALKRGIEIGDRGRIPGPVLEQYLAKNGGPR